MSAGIISVIGGAAGERLLDIRAKLTGAFGIPPDPGAALPHLSYVIGESFEPNDTRRLLKRLAATHRASQVYGFGPCVFGGEPGTLFLGLTRTPRLSRLQEELAVELHGVVSEPTLFSTPQRWVPHVTLATLPADLADGRALHWMASLDLGGPWPIDNLSYVSLDGDTIVEHLRLPLRP